MTVWHRGEAPPWLNVSRETLDRLEAFLALVEKWQPTINLIAAGTLAQAWHRHILDSAQIFTLCPEGAQHWADFGSGGGFPGLVVAILAAEARPGLKITLVESDKRKGAFLMQAARQLGLTVQLLPQRAESLAPLQADVISARALAALTDLCALTMRHIAPAGVAIFPKGAQAEAEVAEAGKLWQFNATLVQSHTDPAGRIVTMKNLTHA